REISILRMVCTLSRRKIETTIKINAHRVSFCVNDLFRIIIKPREQTEIMVVIAKKDIIRAEDSMVIQMAFHSLNSQILILSITEYFNSELLRVLPNDLYSIQRYCLLLIFCFKA
ncbi:hypothetical protein NEAUS03_2353, partial [Nematocida ausubeli]